jgi:hypothetical protein
MLPAKLVDPPIPNSTKEKTDCSSSPATLAVPDVQSLLSKLVSPLKSGKEEDNRVKGLMLRYHALFNMSPSGAFTNSCGLQICFGWGPRIYFALHGIM